MPKKHFSTKDNIQTEAPNKYNIRMSETKHGLSVPLSLSLVVLLIIIIIITYFNLHLKTRWDLVLSE